ncbi:membrane associated rhomboid family serine protease [Catalinimonas alkaloidigena]|uniref:rhomboid family intramembrane serine protease n=1 Tax=Catalinimonas alkaloidigena TaxID=1075417 RepID=UPI002405A6E0|nr:rhomboid family intramembrane serine protease [Catalinimonas alkaloidigena]MDF9798269.1 membrane associated rhomboid family serine protease [Catalinimonas alkaloidigena]
MDSITIILIVISVAASLYAWNKPEVMYKWIFNPYSVYTKQEYWRFITSGFIHQDYMHLFFNMFTLYFFGSVIEQYYAYLFGGTLGIVLFVGMYLVAIVISDVATYIKHREDPSYNSLGASGGVSAVVFSAIMFDPTSKIYLFGLIGIPGFILGALFLLYSYQRSKQMRDRINHDAHLYGALFGVIFTVIIEPNVISHFITEISNFSFF